MYRCDDEGDSLVDHTRHVKLENMERNTTSSLTMMRSFSIATLPIASSSSFENIFPSGLCGVFRTIILVFSVHFDRSSSISRIQSDAECVSLAAGGRMGT